MTIYTIHTNASTQVIATVDGTDLHASAEVLGAPFNTSAELATAIQAAADAALQALRDKVSSASTDLGL